MPPKHSTVAAKRQPLHVLCCSRSAVALEAVRSRLGRGEDPRSRSDDGLTLLHVAAAYDSLAICQLLMHFGADPLAQDDLGRTPLSMATGTSKTFLDRHLVRDIRDRRGVLRRLFLCHSGAAVTKEKPDSFIRNVKDRVRRSFQGVLRRNATSETTLPVTINAKGIYPTLPPLAETPVYRPAPRRARTPDTLRTPAKVVQTPRRSKTPDFDPAMGRTPRTAARGTARTLITASEHRIPASTANPKTTPKYVKQPRKLPTAPPMTPEPALVATPKRKPRSKSADSNKRSSDGLSDYMTAAEESFEVQNLENRLAKLKIDVPSTPTNVDEGQRRRIKRMKDPQLRDELKKLGIHPGPICARTRPMYEKKLLVAQTGQKEVRGALYSRQLEMAFKGLDDQKNGKKLDELIRTEFQPEGVTAFVYLLLDPRTLGDTNACTFKSFVESVFYVGKGTKARPLAHLIDAKKMREIGSPKLATNAKLQRINSIWCAKLGVVLLEISHTISDHEAFVREAAFFEAFRMENLTNIKGGEWHGSSRSWDARTRADLGVYLLRQAMGVLRTMGARPVFPDALPESVYPNVTQRRR